MDRADLISTLVRFCAAATLSYFTVKHIVKYLDPNYESKKENKKIVSFLKHFCPFLVARIFEELEISKPVDLNEHEVRIAMQFVAGDDTGADWEQIGGCDELIAELKDRIILPLRISAEIKNPLLSPPRGVLLYGPPGCGKTLLAKAVSKAAQCRFINLQVSDLTDKWYGESQKLAAAVFSVAQKFQPVIIFIDEIDSFLRDRQANDHEATAMMKAQFMTLWDGFASTNDQIIVMGATNRPQDVDAAILRRLPARFHVNLPNEKQREHILKVILHRETLAPSINLAKIARMADCLSGSDLKEVCRLAVLARAKATLVDQGNLNEIQPLQTEDLLNAIKKYNATSAVGLSASHDYSLD